MHPEEAGGFANSKERLTVPEYSAVALIPGLYGRRQSIPKCLANQIRDAPPVRWHLQRPNGTPPQTRGKPEEREEGAHGQDDHSELRQADLPREKATEPEAA
jgi:hypothetical protein